MHFRWQNAVPRSESTEGSGGSAPPRQDPPRQDPPRQDPPRQDPPRQHESDPGPRRTPADQIAELRAEAAQYRIAARTAAEERDQAIADAQSARAGLERTKAEAVAPLTAKLAKATQSILDATIQSHLVALGLQDIDLIGLASKMPEAPKVELDDEFQVTGAKEFAEAFKKWKPQFFQAAPPPKEGGKEERKPPPKTGNGGEPSGSSDPPVVDVKKMTPAEFAAFKAQTLRGMRTLGR